MQVSKCAEVCVLIPLQSLLHSEIVYWCLHLFTEGAAAFIISELLLTSIGEPAMKPIYDEALEPRLKKICLSLRSRKSPMNCNDQI